MDKIQKFLNKLDSKNRERIDRTIVLIIAREWLSLDIKKLSSREGWRVRVGDFRIKFYINIIEDKVIFYDIQRRGDHTY